MNNSLLSKVFGWMFVGLLVTFLTGYFVSLNPNMLMNIMSTTGLLIIVIIEFALVIFLSTRVFKMSPTGAKISFLLYSFVSGLTFSSIFIVYELNSIMFVFLIAALIFGIFAVLGSVTKIDLTKFGTYLMIALIGILLCCVINMFLQSSTFELIISIISILVFIGFTLYDTKKILKLSNQGLPEENLAIYGALELYLDFINLFLDLLRIFGNSRDN